MDPLATSPQRYLIERWPLRLDPAQPAFSPVAVSVLEGQVPVHVPASIPLSLHWFGSAALARSPASRELLRSSGSSPRLVGKRIRPGPACSGSHTLCQARKMRTNNPDRDAQPRLETWLFQRPCSHAAKQCPVRNSLREC